MGSLSATTIFRSNIHLTTTLASCNQGFPIKNKYNTLLNQSSKGLKIKKIHRDFARNVLPSSSDDSPTCDLLRNQTPQDEQNQVDPRKVLAIILQGGSGAELFPLTARIAPPAVSIGGCYKLIDIPMSNCINSGINKVFVLTQFNSVFLNRHVHRTYSARDISFVDGFVEVLAATQTPGEAGMKWFQGTADAIRQFLWQIEDVKNKDVENIVVLSGDQLYRMDYMDIVQHHIDTKADITVSCAPVGESRAPRHGLMKIDKNDRVVEFYEKPTGRELLSMSVNKLASLQNVLIKSVFGHSSHEIFLGKPYIASMGVYVFKKETLIDLLKCRYPTANDFGSEIIPTAVKELNVKAYLFDDYWEDIGTLKAFYDANLALTKEKPKFEFYDPKTPFYTSPRFLPPTKMDNCKIKDAIISHGCFLRECVIERSVVGERSRLDSGVELKDSLMMGADNYQTESEIATLLDAEKVPIGIGRNTKVRKCIIDKNARIGKNVIIKNKDGVKEADRPNEGYYIRSGIVIIMEKATILDDTII